MTRNLTASNRFLHCYRASTFLCFTLSDTRTSWSSICLFASYSFLKTATHYRCCRLCRYGSCASPVLRPWPPRSQAPQATPYRRGPPHSSTLQAALSPLWPRQRASLAPRATATSADGGPTRRRSRHGGPHPRRCLPSRRPREPAPLSLPFSTAAACNNSTSAVRSC